MVVLLKGVPARTTQAVQVGGVLDREAMELLLNPHDAPILKAAHYPIVGDFYEELPRPTKAIGEEVAPV
jgi:hypothetical protein